MTVKVLIADDHRLYRACRPADGSPIRGFSPFCARIPVLAAA
jgi:hypothetical protein